MATKGAMKEIIQIVVTFQSLGKAWLVLPVVIMGCLFRIQLNFRKTLAGEWKFTAGTLKPKTAKLL